MTQAKNWIVLKGLEKRSNKINILGYRNTIHHLSWRPEPYATGDARSMQQAIQNRARKSWRARRTPAELLRYAGKTDGEEDAYLYGLQSSDEWESNKLERAQGDSRKEETKRISLAGTKSHDTPSLLETRAPANCGCQVQQQAIHNRARQSWESLTHASGTIEVRWRERRT